MREAFFKTNIFYIQCCGQTYFKVENRKGGIKPRCDKCFSKRVQKWYSIDKENINFSFPNQLWKIYVLDVTFCLPNNTDPKIKADKTLLAFD